MFLTCKQLYIKITYPLAAFALVLLIINESNANQADSLLALYSQKLALHKHFSADFTQYRYMSIFKNPLVSTGTISFSYPDKILFHYKTPFESIILFKEGSMKRYRIENGKYIKQPSLEIVAKAITREILRYLTGEFTKEFPYKTKFDPSKPRLFILIPTSAAVNAVFSCIDLLFSKDSQYIAQIKLVEKNGDYILIKHETPCFEPVPDSVFKVSHE